MPDEQIRIDVTAEDDASKVLEAVADDAEALEKLTPEVQVGADTDTALRGIRDVADEARELSGKDVEILLRAKIDDAKAGLKALKDDLNQVDDKARDTGQQLDRMGGDGGLRTRGNAIADLTGPLGDASGAASDFAGVFDGLGDIAEDIAGKVGVSAAAMSTAIGGIGIAVAGAAAVWTLFSQRQQKAREEQRELVEGQKRINEALKEGDRLAAATELEELYKSAYDAARQLGIADADVTRFLTGQTTALEGLERANRQWQAAQNDGFGQQDIAMRKFDELAGSIDSARGKYIAANGTLADQETRLGNIAGALGDVATETGRTADATIRAFDRIRGALDMQSAIDRFESEIAAALWTAGTESGNTADGIRGLKDAILEVAEFAKLTPIQVASLLQRVDAGDYAGVAADVERLSAGAPVDIYTALRDPSSYDVAEYRRRLTAAIGDVPIATRAVIRGENGQLWT